MKNSGNEKNRGFQSTSNRDPSGIWMPYHSASRVHKTVVAQCKNSRTKCAQIAPQRWVGRILGGFILLQGPLKMVSEETRSSSQPAIKPQFRNDILRNDWDLNYITLNVKKAWCTRKTISIEVSALICIELECLS